MYILGRLFTEAQRLQCIRLLGCITLAGLFMQGTMLHAQNEASPEQSLSDTQNIPQTENTLTQKSIQDLKTQAAESSDLDAPTKAKLQDLYDQILTQAMAVFFGQTFMVCCGKNRFPGGPSFFGLGHTRARGVQ